MSFETKNIRVDTEQFSLIEFFSLLKTRKVCFRENYERGYETWGIADQSKYIESLLLGLPAGTFCLDATHDEVWQIIDGCQRFEAVYGFTTGGYRLHDDLFFMWKLAGMTFEGLPRKWQRVIEAAPVICHMMMPGTPEEVKPYLYQKMNPQRFL